MGQIEDYAEYSRNIHWDEVCVCLETQMQLICVAPAVILSITIYLNGYRFT